MTNPFSCKINGVSILGTSGQNVKDIRQYANYFEDRPMEALELTLRARHLFPTSPDTLRSYPFVNEDPFVIDELPNIYFAGN